MQESFDRRVGGLRDRGSAALAFIVVLWELVLLVVDVAAERVSVLYSHRSFHGRRRPDLGVVRPPNMSKDEWFGTAGNYERLGPADIDKCRSFLHASGGKDDQW